MPTFPFKGFYPFDDNVTEDELIARCRNVDLNSLCNIKLQNEFSVFHLNCRSIVNKLDDIALLNTFLMCPQIFCYFLKLG